MKNLLASGCIFLSFASFAAYANNIEITPLLGYRFGGDFETIEDARDIKLSDKASLGALIAWPFDSQRQGELLLSHYESEFDDANILSTDSTDIGVSYLHLGGNVQLHQGVVPFWLSDGIGLTHFSPDGDEYDSETKFSANLGLNSRFPLGENISLRLGARIYGTLFNSDTKLFCNTDTCALTISSELWVQSELNAGITFKF